MVNPALLYQPIKTHYLASIIRVGGIQFAAAQMPRLELLDCGMTICDPDSDESLEKVDKLIYQKLIIKHSRLKKLSLWGCSGLDVKFSPVFLFHGCSF